MPAYIVSMMTITDAETYKKYTDRTPPTLEKYGGKFLTRGEAVETLEGEAYEGRMVLIEFPSTEHAKEWMADPAYQEAMTFRHASSLMHRLLIQEGGENTSHPDPKL